MTRRTRPSNPWPCRSRGGSPASAGRVALVALIVAAGASTAPMGAAPLRAQEPDRVLVRSRDMGPEGPLEVDRGASGLWFRLNKLRTTASVLYTTGHPDDEEAGALTLLSRGLGARTALLTLNRGEGGANAIGAELFDGLGLIRSEELRLSGRYYGLDDQYFTSVVDYGYSKTLEEAMRSWDREALLADMVRIIRLNRPTVVISRWHGSGRDGHGHHQAAGVLTPEAVAAAADPERFPEQIAEEGLRPWRVRRLYRSRLLLDEPSDARLEHGAWDPWLGRSYLAFGALGLSLQRSQTQGRVRRGSGTPARYERLPAPGDDTASTNPAGTPLDGLPTRLPEVGALVGASLPADAREALSRADAAVARALADFDPGLPGGVVTPLVEALVSIREARRLLEGGDGTPDVDFELAVKERQASHALLMAAGVEVESIVTPRGSAPTGGMGPAVPGQQLDVHVTVTAGRPADAPALDLRLVSVELGSRIGGTEGSWRRGPMPLDEPVALTLAFDVPDDAEPTRPWFHRTDVRSNVYQVRDSTELHLGEDRPRLVVRATLVVEGVEVPVDVPVLRWESAAPFGSLRRPFEVAPAVAVGVAPGLVLPRQSDGGWTATATITSNAPEPIEATVRLEAGGGWRTTPEAELLAFTGPGEVRTVTFQVRPASGAASANDVARVDGPGEDARGSDARVTVDVDGRVYTEGYTTIRHPDLQTRRLYTEARVHLPAVDARVPEGLRVGYVMGVGDAVPEAIEQLGAAVELLDETALEGGALDRFDAVMVGTRAYAVRPDLVAANARLLEYAERGGHLVVLYQTPEYVPAIHAPFPATLPGNAEETSEEDAPVRLLRPDHPLVATPYRLSVTDFDGWIEQRGSKFFATWDEAYTPLVETSDTGQAPQRGVWLSAPLGEGRFTYVALALHRQLPYGVPGAYRILANLIVAER